MSRLHGKVCSNSKRPLKRDLGSNRQWTSMATLFVSHSSSDRATSKRVVERLAAEGSQPCSSTSTPSMASPAGRAWHSELYVQLRKADWQGVGHGADKGSMDYFLGLAVNDNYFPSIAFGSSRAYCPKSWSLSCPGTWWICVAI